MQTLTLAAQNSVSPRDIGVATSAATFFRQIGGTMGTAVLLSVLFSLMPTNITGALQDESDLKSALNAALNPAVANAEQNAGVMDQIWDPIVTPVKRNVQDGLDQGAVQAKRAADQAVTERVTAAVQQQVAAGRVPAAAADTVIAQQVDDAKGAAEQQALQAAAAKANAEVVDGTLQVDYANADQRRAVVDAVAPELVDQLRDGKGGTSSTTSSTNDTSFLNGADPRLSRPFLVGFSDSAVTVYWVGLAVVLIAFVLTWFFRVPPLRKTSALQEQADAARKSADDERLTVDAQQAAAGSGSLVSPDTGSMAVVPTSPDVPAQPRSAQAPSGPADATTHGAHAAPNPVDEPPTLTGAIRTQHGAHAAGTTPVPPAGHDDHPHGRHSAE
jgi:hypothetical protein